MDTRAITHILSQPHRYPKPSFVRDTLASMAGEHGLLVVEGAYCLNAYLPARTDSQTLLHQATFISDRYDPPLMCVRVC